MGKIINLSVNSVSNEYLSIFSKMNEVSRTGQKLKEGIFLFLKNEGGKHIIPIIN